MYHHATVAVLLSRSWRVRKRAQQTVRKLLSSLGGSSLAHGLLGELRVVINKHKVQNDYSTSIKYICDICLSQVDGRYIRISVYVVRYKNFFFMQNKILGVKKIQKSNRLGSIHHRP